jgi:hypothetical protein
MKSNPTRAGPSLFGNPHPNLSKGNETGNVPAEESEGVCSQCRLVTSDGEGAK